ncbi:MAG: DNA cytosine methyltransferase [Victivallales bacterium]|nr:DNA cytosine methyltransferase [Victivallales bacterium]
MKRLTYITLFSSAGVGCYGFKLNGFECIATNELLEARLDVQRANHKCKYPSGYIAGDVRLEETQKKLFDEIDRWRNNEGVNQVDVVFATPPCQGMSTVNYKKNDKEQIRNSLVVQAIKIICQVQPKVFVFENVRAFMKTICTDLSGEDVPISESISRNLSKEYNIYHKIINFKDYSVPSSRPRTIVIGVSRQLSWISPLNLFPTRQREISLREAIGDFPPLEYGQKDPNDFLHFARPFPEYQLEWIADLKEGQSAFEKPEERQPSKIDKDGKRVILKGAYMGNKYRRLVWDKPCSCIATRNDILSSQDTIHPRDNRVLSIRELMRLMTIPDNFMWTDHDHEVTVATAESYLANHELNIRRCIGEAVPTQIIKDISGKIRYEFEKDERVSAPLTQGELFSIIKDLNPEYDKVKILISSKIDEVILPQLISLYSNSDMIEIEVIDNESISSDQKTGQNASNISIRKINKLNNEKYTLSIIDTTYGNGWDNLSWSIEKAEEIVLITKKSFLFLSDYEKTRKQLAGYGLARICEINNSETISLHFINKWNGNVIIENWNTQEIKETDQNNVRLEHLWTLYADNEFLRYKNSLDLGVYIFPNKEENIANTYTEFLKYVEKLPAANLFVKRDQSLYSSPDFEKYIDTLRSHSKTVIVLDDSLVYYIGVRKILE